MKNYKVKITRNFTDIEEKIDRVLGTETEEFMCTKERYEYLVSCNNAVELVEIIDNEVTEEVVNEIVEEQNDEEIEEKPKRKSNKK